MQRQRTLAHAGRQRARSAEEPWRQENIALPAASAEIPSWDLPPANVQVSMVHAHHLNSAEEQSRNRHQVEAASLVAHWQNILTHLPLRVVCDRLGGRKHHQELAANGFALSNDWSRVYHRAWLCPSGN